MRQYLKAGSIDSLHIVSVPVLLGVKQCSTDWISGDLGIR